MFFSGKQYNVKKVVNLIIKNNLDSAISYMIDHTEDEIFDSLKFQLVACGNRLNRIKLEHLGETVKYETYNISKNRLVYHLQLINVEINKLYTENNELDEATEKKTPFSHINKKILFPLCFALLCLLIPFCLYKIYSTYNGIINIENLQRQFVIEDFYITNMDCINSTYAIIKIKNTGQKDLNNVAFKWTPDINVPDFSLGGQIESLSTHKTDSIKILLNNRDQYKPGRYRSSIEEDHPVPILTKVYQNYETIACQNKALPKGVQKGDQIKIIYVSKHEATTHMTSDSISLPITSTILDTKKITD